MSITERKAAEQSTQSPIFSSNTTFNLVVVAAFVLLVLQALHYYPFMEDDAFISLRYSQRLLEGKGLTWSDGQSVEGYSNLLWVLLCAGLGKLGVDLVSAARLLGSVSTVAAFAGLVAYLRAAFIPARRPLAAICSLVPFALSASIAVWMVGGLEASLLIGLLSWVLVNSFLFFKSGARAPLFWASLLLAGVTLTRADGFVYPLSIAASLAIGLALRRQSILPAAITLIGPIIAYSSQLAFRLQTYHEWLPNTAYVKVSFTLHRLLTGIFFVTISTVAELTLVVLAVIGCVMLWRQSSGRALALLYLLTGLGVSGYLIVANGDFTALRCFLPVVLVLCFAAAHASLYAYDQDGTLLRGRPARLIALSLAVIALSSLQAGTVAGERYEWQGRALGLYLKHHLPPTALVCADAAGAIPFYSELDAIDPLGLNDHHIAHLTPATKGHGFQGHELGDGKYVLDRKPDVIVFGTTGTATPIFPSDRQIFAEPRFASEYELKRLNFTEPSPWTSEVYVKRQR